MRASLNAYNRRRSTSCSATTFDEAGQAGYCCFWRQPITLGLPTATRWAGDRVVRSEATRGCYCPRDDQEVQSRLELNITKWGDACVELCWRAVGQLAYIR